ncbi:MAG TPA: TraR/DksA family transcriptional regulator [Burkholderiales bacterium]|nr:TraR/DksA family transcriptional regulator [Burkholderiales bacterium]
MPLTASHMHYFTLEQREALRRQLEARAAMLRGVIGEDSVADLTAEPAFANLERELAELREVETALARLHEPDFGICGDCGGDIPFSRLQAAPGAIRCAACQGKRERAGGPGR